MKKLWLKNGVLVFPDAAAGHAASSIDPNLLLALQNNGGFGGNNWIWILFLWMMWGANGNGWGNNRNGTAETGFLSNQLNNNAGRDMLLQAINGRADAISQLAQMTNSSIDSVKSCLCSIQSAIQSVGSQVGMSGLETINALQLGNANLSRQICECCCENRLAICQQTNSIQSTLASNHADDILQAEKNAAGLQLQLSQLEGANKLSICQQTNALQNQAERDTNSILNAIAGQNTLITKEFCDLKERELQSKIDT